jgi:membrane-associated phospholipid phosphatase
METVLQWGLDCIRAIQSFSNQPLTAVMRIVTGLGSASCYAIVLLFLYWCIDEKKGVRLGLVLLVSAWINISLKLALNQPRPFFEAYDPVLGMIPERLGGFPSGHAQNSLVVWIIIASWGTKKWLYGIAAFVCLAVSFSRVYLGVHFPTDILGGWIIGAVILCGYFCIVKRVKARFDSPAGEGTARFNPLELLARGGFRAELIAAAAVSFIMILYRPTEEALMPGALFLGMATGYSLNRHYIGFKSSGTRGKSRYATYLTLFFRCLTGIAGMVLLFMAFKKIIPGNRYTDYYVLLSFSRFVIMALWVYAGAPCVFGLLRLAEPKKEA